MPSTDSAMILTKEILGCFEVLQRYRPSSGTGQGGHWAIDPGFISGLIQMNDTTLICRSHHRWIGAFEFYFPC